MTIAFDLNACCSFWEKLTVWKLEEQHFVFLHLCVKRADDQ